VNIPFKNRRTLAAGLAASLLATGVIGLATQSADATAITPPWHGGTADPDRVGGLTLYDATGNPITTGSVTDTPIAAYAAGTTVIRGGDTKASLFVYTPSSDTPEAGWPGQQISAATTYPVPSAPSGLPSGKPVHTGSNDETTLSDYIKSYPNNEADTTSDYYGIYEIRLRTSAPAQPFASGYDAVDVQVTGDTWTVIYPANQTSSSVTATWPASTTYGKAFSVGATVSSGGSPASGSVVLKDGTTTVATKTLSGGKATFSVGATALKPGTHKLSIQYAGSLTVASSSATKSLVVAKAASKSVAKLAKATVKHTARGKVTIIVTATGVVPTGKVTVYDGTRKIATGTLAKGKVVITLPKLKKGKHKLTATYAGSTLVSTSRSAAVTLKST